MTHSSFNPSLAPAQRLEAILIGRHAQADRLTEQLWESSRETAGKPAILLRGQRGIGKSHLVSMVTHRLVERNKECNRLAIAWLSEDPWLIQDRKSVV